MTDRRLCIRMQIGDAVVPIYADDDALPRGITYLILHDGSTTTSCRDYVVDALAHGAKLEPWPDEPHSDGLIRVHWEDEQLIELLHNHGAEGVDIDWSGWKRPATIIELGEAVADRDRVDTHPDPRPHLETIESHCKALRYDVTKQPLDKVEAWVGEHTDAIRTAALELFRMAGGREGFWDPDELQDKLREMAADLCDMMLHEQREYAELMIAAADEIDKQREFADASRQESASLREECKGNRERTARAADELKPYKAYHLAGKVYRILTETD